MAKPEFTPLTPKIVLGVVAHPDDLEFGAAGTMAKYALQGADVYYYVLTNGNKGSSDLSASPDSLRDMRRDEQWAAAKILGVKDVFFGDYEDGALECNQAVKRDIVRKIRELKPEVVVTFDPTVVYSANLGIINHTDHRAAGQASLDAVYPLARDHLSFSELAGDGLESHKVTTVLMINFDDNNYCEDITATFELKMQALAAHASQVPDFDKTRAILEHIAHTCGNKTHSVYAEGFVRLDLPQ